jgi:hypothetical protein
VLGAFDAEDVARAFEARDFAGAAHGAPIVVIDASSGKKDSFTWAVVRRSRLPSGLSVVRFELVDGLSGALWRGATGAAIVARVAAIARAHKARSVHGDQRESLMIASEFLRHGVRFREHTWTAASKPPAVETVRRWFREGVIALPPHEKLRRELLAFEERLSPSGAFTFGARGSGNDDYVALCLTAAMSDAAGALRGPSSDQPTGWVVECLPFEDRPVGFPLGNGERPIGGY